jgi:itaconate CoA-transferase
LSSAEPGQRQPLEGLLVVALEHAVAAPFATRQLADLGARVIKVERPGTGDFARHYDRTVNGDASYFIWLNRGKQSVELDLKDPGDRMVLDLMVERADVVVQNLAPGAVERLGLDATTLRTSRPELVHCSISGYGAGGPYADKKAYDLLVQCEAGLLATTGTAQEMVKAGISVADIATGMYALTGVLTALYERRATGQGATLEVAMLDALGEWMMQPTYYSVYGDVDSPRTGARHATISPYGPFRVRDGHVFLGIQNDREWARFCHDVIATPELVDDPRFRHNSDRVAHDGELTTIIEGALRATPVAAAVPLLESAGIACARLRTPREFFDHPQLAARDRWRTVEAPGGPVRALVPPVTVAGREVRLGGVPRLGQDNDAIRREFAPRTGPGAQGSTT